MAEDDEAFSFGDFVFSAPLPQPQSQPQPQPFPINGGFSSASPDDDDDDDWGDFVAHPQPQPILSNGFSHSPQPNPLPPINSKTPINLDIFSANPAGPAADPAPKSAQKPRGALPLSLFGEVEDEEDKPDSIDTGNKNSLNGFFNPNSRPQNGKIEVKIVSNGGGFNSNGDVLANLYLQSQPIKSEIGSGLNSGVSAPDLNNLDEGDEGDDEWEFMGAYPANGHVKGNEEQGSSVLSGSKVEPGVVISQEKQDASSWAEYKHGSSSSLPQFIDLFGASHGAVNKSNEINVGLNNSSATVNTNGLIPDLFNGIKAAGAGSGISTAFVNENDDLFSGHHGAIHKSDEMHVGFNNIAIRVDTNGFMPDVFNGIEATGDGSGMSATSVNENGDLFSGHHGAIHKSNEKHVGLNNISIKVDTNGFMPDLFHGVEAIGYESGISATSLNEDDDFDDFGDFVDASPEVSPQKQDQCNSQSTAMQLPNGKIEDQQTQSENSRGPLPLSLFSDGLEESKLTNDDLTQRDKMLHKPIATPGSTFSTQSSGISIHDLLSNLYSQSQPTSSIDSPKNPSENGIRSSPKTEGSTPFGYDDELDDDSWEFKDASSEGGIQEQSPGASPGTLPQKPLETTSNLQFYMDFYVKLKEFLCILLSHQLNEEKESPSSGTIGDDGKAEALSHDIKEAYKLLERNITTEELLLKKRLDRSQCLYEVLEALQGPKCKVIESEYSLSELLQLAANDWRTATELLRHAVSVLQILSLGSADEQSVYVSSWLKIISVCLLELRHGALIWKRASEKSLQAQVLADARGQRYIQALGEIYKVVELLRLSTTLYKPWMLLSMQDPDPQQSFGLLEECASLWSSSGLEEALQNISDNVGPGHDEAAKALITSIKGIRDVDVLALHDHIFVQQKSICRLSLLPLEMISDLKVAVWNTEPFFLNLANLWANLISRNPPQLPGLQVR